MSIRQDLPTTCRHPLAPQDLPSHPTQREEVVKGGRGRERENRTKMWSMPHTTTQTRWKDDRERHYSDGDDWLWWKWTRLEGQIPPHCCARLLCQSQAEQDWIVSLNFLEIHSKNVTSISLICVDSCQNFWLIMVHAKNRLTGDRAKKRKEKKIVWHFGK